jgi:hypothetical protein
MLNRIAMQTSRLNRSNHRTKAIAGVAVSLAVIILVAILAYRWRARPDVTIGVEGMRVVEISGPRLVAMPFTPGDALAVRIADVQPTASGFRYDLRYMAFGPGEHDIGQSLKRPDGTSPETRKDLAVSVAALIPEDDSGELYAAHDSPIDLRSGYTLMMSLAWGLWAAVLVPLAWYGHKKRRRMAPPPPPPSIAQRLRVLLEQASRENLCVEQQADLEQLLLAFWSKRLKLSEERLSDAIEQLRSHPQAGAQWERVERWLHSRTTTPGGSVARQLLSDIESLN